MAVIPPPQARITHVNMFLFGIWKVDKKGREFRDKKDFFRFRKDDCGDFRGRRNKNGESFLKDLSPLPTEGVSEFRFL